MSEQFKDQGGAATMDPSALLRWVTSKVMSYVISPKRLAKNRIKVSKDSDLVSPGHVFPIKARSGGVLVRAGHTEAAVDISRLAGKDPSGVICEIMNDDGTMARVLGLQEIN